MGIDKIYAGLNCTTAKDAFYGAAGYVQIGVSEQFTIGIRGEYFSDEGIGAIDMNTEDSENVNVFDVTLSANFKVGNLTIIPEVRLDAFSQDIVMPDLENPTDMQNNLASFLIAAVYSF